MRRPEGSLTTFESCGIALFVVVAAVSLIAGVAMLTHRFLSYLVEYLLCHC